MDCGHGWFFFFPMVKAADGDYDDGRGGGDPFVGDGSYRRPADVGFDVPAHFLRGNRLVRVGLKVFPVLFMQVVGIVHTLYSDEMGKSPAGD